MTEENKFKVGEYWKRRDGKKVQIVLTDLKNDFSLAYRVMYPDGEQINYVRKNGNMYSSEKYGGHDFDLIEPYREPVKVEGYINLYPHGSGGFYTTKEKADDAATSSRIACVFVKGVEGENGN